MTIILGAGETRKLDVSLTPVPPQPARLWGYVTDATTGAPIVGARVELIGALYDLTDATGKYDITGITPGTYSGKVSASGYVDYNF